MMEPALHCAAAWFGLEGLCMGWDEIKKEDGTSTLSFPGKLLVQVKLIVTLDGSG